ncbi:hypothetical protein LX36DRAFT_473734 [Colletotrichum falcatum]|nr:hypothetical protein LX36DRAFT_473734 [Colletotrichum falcatum]
MWEHSQVRVLLLGINPVYLIRSSLSVCLSVLGPLLLMLVVVGRRRVTMIIDPAHLRNCCILLYLYICALPRCCMPGIPSGSGFQTTSKDNAYAHASSQRRYPSTAH